MALEISVRSVALDKAVVTLSGPLTLGTNLKTADACIRKAIEDGAIRLVLDMSAVTYVDSAGLGTLVHSYGLADSKGGGVRLVGVSERIAALLKMTHMDELLVTDADVDASLAALG